MAFWRSLSRTCILLAKETLSRLRSCRSFDPFIRFLWCVASLWSPALELCDGGPLEVERDTCGRPQRSCWSTLARSFSVSLSLCLCGENIYAVVMLFCVRGKISALNKVATEMFLRISQILGNRSSVMKPFNFYFCCCTRFCVAVC